MPMVRYLYFYALYDLVKLVKFNDRVILIREFLKYLLFGLNKLINNMNKQIMELIIKHITVFHF